MKWIVAILLLMPVMVRGQIITTVTGGGTVGVYNGAPATAIGISYPDGCAFDGLGNLYFTTVAPDRVYKITPSGIIYFVAGTGSSGYNGDGIAATSAELNLPTGIAIDKGNNVYIADGENNRVRKIDVNTGIITTFAGDGSAGFSGDNGPATAATFNGVEDICFDMNGNLFIADYANNRIRKVNNSGIVTTVAGNGINGFTADGVAATSAAINSVWGVCTDAIGNLYFNDSLNTMLRKVSTAGILTTVAGNGLAGPAGDNGPATTAALVVIRVAIDKAGNIYTSGYLDNDIRKIDVSGIIHTVAGTGIAGFSGDGSSATMSQISDSYGITLDSCGNLYFADKNNNRIRKVAFNPLCLDNLEVDNVKEGVLSIYPNPAHQLLCIDGLQTPATYRLLNIVGAVNMQGNLAPGNNTIPIKHLPSGMYIMEVTTADGVRTMVRVVKE